MSADPRTTIIDMTSDGRFRQPSQTGWAIRATGLTALAAIVGGALLGLVLAIWLAVTILPVVVGVAVAVFLLARLRAWRRRRGFVVGPFSPR